VEPPPAGAGKLQVAGFIKIMRLLCFRKLYSSDIDSHTKRMNEKKYEQQYPPLFYTAT